MMIRKGRASVNRKFSGVRGIVRRARMYTPGMGLPASLLAPEHLKGLDEILKGLQKAEELLREGLAKRHAEFLHDARWRLMALRAKLEDPGDAPVFSDADQLLKYLGSR